MPILRVWAPDTKTHEPARRPSEPRQQPRKERREREVMGRREGGDQGLPCQAAQQNTSTETRLLEVLDFWADYHRCDLLGLLCTPRTDNRQMTTS